MSNMNLLVVILKHEDLVSEICKELVEEGIHGGTIVDGTGMASVVETINDVIGLDKPNTGIMFELPVSFVEGLGA